MQIGINLPCLSGFIEAEHLDHIRRLKDLFYDGVAVPVLHGGALPVTVCAVGGMATSRPAAGFLPGFAYRELTLLSQTTINRPDEAPRRFVSYPSDVVVEGWESG